MNDAYSKLRRVGELIGLVYPGNTYGFRLFDNGGPKDLYFVYANGCFETVMHSEGGLGGVSLGAVGTPESTPEELRKEILKIVEEQGLFKHLYPTLLRLTGRPPGAYPRFKDLIDMALTQPDFVVLMGLSNHLIDLGEDGIETDANPDDLNDHYLADYPEMVRGIAKILGTAYFDISRKKFSFKFSTPRFDYAIFGEIEVEFWYIEGHMTYSVYPRIRIDREHYQKTGEIKDVAPLKEGTIEAEHDTPEEFAAGMEACLERLGYYGYLTRYFANHFRLGPNSYQRIEAAVNLIGLPLQKEISLYRSDLRLQSRRRRIDAASLIEKINKFQ